MPATLYTITPSAANASGDAFTGQALDDPADYTAAHNSRIDGKFVLGPIQDELLAIIAKMFVMIPNAKTTDFSITDNNTDALKLYTNTGAGGEVIATLPAVNIASAPYVSGPYIFLSENSNSFKVACNGADTIDYQGKNIKGGRVCAL